MKTASRGNPNQLLKAERELRGWSQKYVADQIGADYYYLSRWERGTTVPSPIGTNLRKEMTKQGFICEDISSMKEAISSPKGALS